MKEGRTLDEEIKHVKKDLKKFWEAQTAKEMIPDEMRSRVKNYSGQCHLEM